MAGYNGSRGGARIDAQRLFRFLYDRMGRWPDPISPRALMRLGGVSPLAVCAKIASAIPHKDAPGGGWKSDTAGFHDCSGGESADPNWTQGFG